MQDISGPSEVAAAPAVTCPSCGVPVAARFCSACGERMLSARDHSLLAFMAEAASHVFTLDNRLWRTLRAMLRPGLLTAEYAAGRRTAYLSPVQIFVLLTVAFFLVGPPLGLMDTRLAQFENDPVTAIVAAPVIAAGVERTGLDRAAYDERFDRSMAAQRRFLIVLAVPLFALVIKALHPQRSYVLHLAFATHTIATLLVGMFIYLTLLFAALALVLQPLLLRLGGPAVWPPPAPVALLLVAGPVLLYLYAALRHVHAGSRGASLLRAAVALVGLYAALIAYEHVLFFTTALAMYAGG